MPKRKVSRTAAIATLVLVALTVANVVLKLTGVVSFSWWFVFLPLWAAPLLVIFALGFFMLCWGIVISNANKSRKK